jgi:hypothetical protein
MVSSLIAGAALPGGAHMNLVTTPTNRTPTMDSPGAEIYAGRTAHGYPVPITSARISTPRISPDGSVAA